VFLFCCVHSFCASCFAPEFFWKFILHRRAGPLICLRHADLLIQMLKRLPLSRGEELRLGVALKRLVQLLPDHRQVEIARTYPISEDGNLLVWRFLGEWSFSNMFGGNGIKTPMCKINMNFFLNCFFTAGGNSLIQTASRYIWPKFV